jgi:hypothetical protein
MSQLHRAACLHLGLIFALASSAMPALGSSIGFHEYLQRHHSESLDLPRLHEAIPWRVPELSDQALIKLWETNQFSPILRNPKIEMQLYEAVSQWRESNPVWFDSAHRTLGHLLTDKSFFEYYLYLYKLNPGSFVHSHHFLVPFIRGYTMMLRQPHQNQSTGTGPEQVFPPGPASPPVPIPLDIIPILVPPQALSIPEPSSIVILVAGLGFVAARMYGRRRPGSH